MTESTQLNTTEHPFPAHEQGESAPEQQQTPWITYTVICLCAVIWAYLNFAKDLPYYTDVVDTVAPRGFRIWTGAIWALVTAAFVHFDFWHILFNMWWTKDFGRILEPSMGRKTYLAFILAAAIVSSGVQLLFTDQTGIGFSGVVYAMFGFGIVARRVYPHYQQIFDKRTVQWLLIWLGACIVLTHFDVMNIANEAHIAGFLFGLCIGMVFVARSYVAVCSLALALLTSMTVLSVTYLPWSEQWRSRHEILEFVELGEKAKAGDPEAQFQYGDVFMEYEEDKAEGISWLRKSAEQGYVPALNSLAWILATDPDPAFRNGTEAVELALRACEKDGWNEAMYIDTLAAAYAEADRWEEAIATQQQAIEKLGNEEAPVKALYQEHLQKYQQHQKVRE
ncbi:MAG: rhomboid family intramembrane serine protease [Candidatus Electrothrix scaldis]|nr:MAG: rhomboid family intramembrane serine protease [Candidatus Electrothrix sp. GW3-3]